MQQITQRAIALLAYKCIIPLLRLFQPPGPITISVTLPKERRLRCLTRTVLVQKTPLATRATLPPSFHIQKSRRCQSLFTLALSKPHICISPIIRPLLVQVRKTLRTLKRFQKSLPLRIPLNLVPRHSKRFHTLSFRACHFGSSDLPQTLQKYLSRIPLEKPTPALSIILLQLRAKLALASV